MNKVLKQYLEELLGPGKARELQVALKCNKTVVVSGVNISGKTTLCNVLTTYGYHVVEEDALYQLKLTKPLDKRVRNKGDIIKTNMEVEHEDRI